MNKLNKLCVQEEGRMNRNNTKSAPLTFAPNLGKDITTIRSLNPTKEITKPIYTNPIP